MASDALERFERQRRSAVALLTFCASDSCELDVRENLAQSAGVLAATGLARYALERYEEVLDLGDLESGPAMRRLLDTAWNDIDRAFEVDTSTNAERFWRVIDNLYAGIGLSSVSQSVAKCALADFVAIEPVLSARASLLEFRSTVPPGSVDSRGLNSAIRSLENVVNAFDQLVEATVS